MMTEEDAKTKWCPFVRHEGDSGGAFNRGTVRGVLNELVTDNLYSCACIGSACMAWRWAPRYYSTDPEHGFCGLAGASAAVRP